MTDTAAALASKGAALLDSKPELEGWRDRIDTSILDINWPSKCILGQLFPSYYGGLQFLFSEWPGFELKRAEEHGFEPVFSRNINEDDYELAVTFLELNEAWLAELAR